MATKERPILFSGSMVRAILEGRKTQTWRIVKSQPCLLNYAPNQCFMDGYWYPTTPSGKIGMVPGVKCPYGKPGEILWVRESWAAPHAFDHLPPRLIPVGTRITYTASAELGGLMARSPLHMPRWAARIVRPITEIKVERVQAISEADAEAEGVYHDYNLGELARYRIRWPHLSTGQCLYRALWNEINAKPKPRYGREGDKKVITHYEAFPWSEEDFDALCPGAREAGMWKGKPLTVYPNPWVWCISFERREGAPHAS